MVETEKILITAEKGREKYQLYTDLIRSSDNVNKLGSAEVKMVYTFGYFLLMQNPLLSHFLEFSLKSRGIRSLRWTTQVIAGIGSFQGKNWPQISEEWKFFLSKSTSNV